MLSVLRAGLLAAMLLMHVLPTNAQNWDQIIKAAANDRGQNTISDRAADDYFGYSVAISGDYAIVGAYGEDEDASGGATASFAGSAYIFTRSGSTWTQQQKIVASDRAAGDRFGGSVAISGDYAIVGALLEDEDASGGATASLAGSAYIFHRSGSTWTQQQKIVASDRAANDYFGYSVAISGDYAIVGAYAEDEDASGGATASFAGSAYIFNRSGSTWTQQQKIVAADRAANDEFGWSVAISGDYAIVGAYLEDQDASGGATASNAGSAYIFNRSGSTWTLQQKIVASDRAAGDEFGYRVSISGDYAIVGARGEDEDASGGATALSAGSAYIFIRSGSTWTQQQKIVASDRAANDNFGISVAISGDYAIVGAWQEDEDASGGATANNAGSAYIFTRSGSTWTQQQKIVAADRAAEDRFGYSVAISGDYAIVGAYREDEDASGGATASSAGSAYIFNRSGSTWAQQQKVVPADISVVATDDRFGYSVAISGDYAIVGAYWEDENASGGAFASDAGSAYIFNRSGSTWVLQQKIVASDRAAGDNFGYSVSISGDYAIVGAYLEDEDASGGATASFAGSAYIFHRIGSTWTQQQKIVASDRAVNDRFGRSVAISGDYAIVGADLENEDASGGATALSAGSAYIFIRSGSTWTQQQKIVASDRAAGDNFGYSVSISGDYAIVGAWQEDEDASGGATASFAGSAYIFNRSGSTWTQQQKIVASDRAALDRFGFSVAISGDYAIVGAYLEDEDASGGATASDAGSAYIFTRSGSTWTQQQKIVASDRAANDLFGISVAISGDYAIVGAFREDEDASEGATAADAGSAYIFIRSGSTWTMQQKIVASDRSAGDQFGYSVAISGDYAIVGAYGDDEDALGANTISNTGSVYIFYNTNTPLPVTLLDFRGQAVEDYILLTWQTASEFNNNFFTVEKSADALDFYSIAEIRGAGTTHEPQSYEHKDVQPFPVNNYYRLKQTDFDGSIEYSPIIMVYSASGLENGISSIYPNPTKGDLKLVISSTLDQVVQIKLIDIAGRLMSSKDISLMRGVNVIDLDYQQLPAGLYILHYFDKSGVGYHTHLMRQN
jgi:PAS domain-containing protein